MIGHLATGCRCARPLLMSEEGWTRCVKCGHDLKPKRVKAPPKGKRRAPRR